jgi:oligopeptide transport system permease protein
MARDAETSVHADSAARSRSGLARFFRSIPGVLGLGFLVLSFVLCLATLPYTLGDAGDGSSPDAPKASSAARGSPRYNAGTPALSRMPPSWLEMNDDQRARLDAFVADQREQATASATITGTAPATPPAPSFFLGSDHLGRSLLVRVLAGGGISLSIGLAAATLSVFIGTLYGSIAGYAGGRVDSLMMRIVDVLYGLPYILLVVLLAVAVDAAIDDATAGGSQLSAAQVNLISIITLLVAIGGVSWLTMARVVRGQVLSLKAQPFIEAARAIGVPPTRIFLRHLLPNLVGPIVVYATLTVPQAILQESFLSFLGIGVKPPLPSWGNLAADGLIELNPYQSNWWLLVFPCVLLGLTLLALNFVGEGLREALDPKRAGR